MICNDFYKIYYILQKNLHDKTDRLNKIHTAGLKVVS